MSRANEGFMKTQFIKIFTLASLALLAAPFVFAADDATAKSPLDGTWHWEFTMPDTGKVKPALRVKTEDGVLTGSTRFRAGTSTPVTNLTLNGDQVSFDVVRERDDEKTVTHYSGTLKGDKIQGKMVSNWAGEEKTYDWDAVRYTDIEGTWKWRFGFGGRPGGGGGGPAGGGGGGGRFGGGGDITLTIKREQGDRISGKLSMPRLPDSEIKHAHFNNGEVRFTIERERDGEIVSTNFYRGKFSADSIDGYYTSDFGGRVRTNEWRAARAD